MKIAIPITDENFDEVLVKARNADRAIQSHFTSGVDERTGTGSVRNAVGTLERYQRVSGFGGVVKNP